MSCYGFFHRGQEFGSLLITDCTSTINIGRWITVGFEPGTFPYGYPSLTRSWPAPCLLLWLKGSDWGSGILCGRASPHLSPQTPCLAPTPLQYHLDQYRWNRATKGPLGGPGHQPAICYLPRFLPLWSCVHQIGRVTAAHHVLLGDQAMPNIWPSFLLSFGIPLTCRNIHNGVFSEGKPDLFGKWFDI
jgi:hypothetical protein